MKPVKPYPRQIRPVDLLAGSFFTLTLFAALVFDPVMGLGFVLSGFVYMLNQKLAVAEVVILIVVKGQYGLAYTALGFAPLTQEGVMRNLFLLIAPYEGLVGVFAGGLLACKLSAKTVSSVLKKRAPDVMEVLNERKRLA